MERQKRIFDPQNLTRKDLERFEKRARYCANKYGHPELADDFVGEVFEALARGWRQTVDQACLEFIRKLYGRSGSPGYTAKLAAKHRTISIHGFTDQNENLLRLSEFIADPRGDSRNVIESWSVSHITRKLKYREREFVRLYFEQDMNFRLIGEQFGVSESRVSQVMSRILAKLKQQLKADMEKEDQKNKCANTQCLKAAAPGQKYCSAKCAPGSRYSGGSPQVSEPVKQKIVKADPLPKSTTERIASMSIEEKRKFLKSLGYE
jgi:RNA polymerase sigma factor (sigma-70 family)